MHEFSHYMRTPGGRIHATANPEWHRDCEEIKPRKAGRAAYVEQARADLRELLPPGSTVHTILRHVSKSGMSRRLSLLAMTPDGPRDVTYMAAVAADFKMNGDHILVGGCGMGMGFHAVYCLSHALYPDGVPCAGDNCASNDHFNGMPRPAPAGTLHRDGGYALRHAWL